MARLGFSVTGIDGVENVQVARTMPHDLTFIDYRAILVEDLHKEGFSSMWFSPWKSPSMSQT